MFGILALLFFAVPLAELAVIIWVGGHLGIVETIAILVGVSLAGAWMAKQQGLFALRAIQSKLQLGEMPGQELTDGLLVLVAAVLLLTPGFLTDAVALLLLVPPVRSAVRFAVRRRFARRIDIQVYGGPPRDVQ